MRKPAKECFLPALLLIPGAVALAAASPPANLATLLEEVRSETYVTPSTRSLQQAQEGFRQWLAGDDRVQAARGFRTTDSRDAGFDALGFEPMALSPPDVVALAEKADRRYGRGLFAARLQGGAPLLIQAPHQYHDLRTGTLARQLFLESDAMAAAWNTVHRYHGDDTDLVHVPDSYLHALSRAFVEVHPEGRILQLHGFSRSKRKSRAGREAQAILSDGSRYPPRALARLTDCLSQRLDIRASLYPRDVHELGATTNTLAADLRRRDFDGFVHLELDVELRKRLVRDVDARSTLIQCVMEARP